MDRRAIAISGIVQGVGFRPFVFGLASRLGLHGFVRNQIGGVLIEVEGEPVALDTFLDELTAKPPPLAQIDEVRWHRRQPRGESRFRIDPGAVDAAGPIFLACDVATCDACLAELFEPSDRRYRYPFINCTHCGPRLTIITGAPYDRERTTMARFALCPACRLEFDDPGDRRFHAQPLACPACGPRLRVLDGQGGEIRVADPLRCVSVALAAGRIVAVKGLGGYHLACAADDPEAVATLRSRKHRDEKPFALMVSDPGAARALCEVSADEGRLLESASRPIVVLGRRASACVADEVAPGHDCLGVMLPYTPLHHLLLRALQGRPLVMTSGNSSDEPIAYEDDDALARLGGIADLFLTHDRAIHLRCDDSVTRLVQGVELPLRRSRGFAPGPIRLPFACPAPTLALGGQLKAAFALGRGAHAFLSHHVGDLDQYAAYRAYVEAIAHYERLFGVEPALIVHDLHPDYASTAYARSRGGTAPLLAVQHHHAHMASCMAENGLDEPVIGVTFDGTGYGTDGSIWGGEFLVGDYRSYRRIAHLRPVAMPGGEQAVREPWRMASSWLLDAGLEPALLAGSVPAASLAAVVRMIGRGFNAPRTTSMGRLFDAVAALAGVRTRVSYEGQAAIELERRATPLAADGVYPYDLARTAGDVNASPYLIDVRPLIRAVADDVAGRVDPGRIGRRFHSTLVEIVADVVGRIRAETGLEVAVLSGGVFMNALLLREVVSRLSGDGLRVFRHRRVPPNDGGLCLGQLAIAAACPDPR